MLLRYVVTHNYLNKLEKKKEGGEERESKSHLVMKCVRAIEIFLFSLIISSPLSAS